MTLGASFYFGFGFETVSLCNPCWPDAKMMGATTPGSVHFFCAQRIESTVAQLPQQRSRVDRDDITEMTSGGSAQLWRKERSSLGVCGSHLAEQGQPFSDKDKVALH